MTENARSQILYITHRVPHPPNKGDRIRTWNILNFLAERSDVSLACLADEPVSNETVAALSVFTARLTIVPLDSYRRWLSAAVSLALGKSASAGAFWSNQLARELQDWALAIPFDAVLISASSLVPYLQLPALRHLHAVVDLIDVDSQKWFDYADNIRGPRALLYRWEGYCVRAIERSLPNHVAAILLVSATEANIYRQYAPSDKINVVSCGVTMASNQILHDDNSYTCGFVGALDYRPNVDALEWFCTNVWPRVFASGQDARFMIVGRKPNARIQKLARQPGVDLIGEVSDVHPYIRQMMVVVAPLRLARGLQTKILEAMAACKPVISSPAAVQGIAAQAGSDLLVASTPDEWVDKILSLWRDPTMRQSLAARGRAFVEHHHQWQQCLEPLTSILKIKRCA